MDRPYTIHALGAQLKANRLIRGVSLDLGGKFFRAPSIVLPNQGIDVIL